MSTPYPQGEQDRPLTRREMRELADRQEREAREAHNPPAAVGVPAQTPTFDSVPTHSQFPSQNQFSMQSQFPTQPAAPMQRTRVPQYSTPPVSPAAQPRVADAQYRTPQNPAQRASQQRAQEQGAPQQQAPHPTLEPRGIVDPYQQPVQVSRRSMYTQSPAASIPQVSPPAQAGAVRMLEETGVLSNLVAPTDFEDLSTQSRTTNATVPAPQRAGLVPPHTQVPQQNADSSSRSNLSNYMRQAPPSSQIPRVEQDAAGNWVASSPAVVAERSDRPILPNWDGGLTPFAQFSQNTAASVPTYEPAQSFTNREQAADSLPARNSSFPPIDPFASDSAFAANGLGAGPGTAQAPFGSNPILPQPHILSSEPDAFPPAPSNYREAPEVAPAAPAWDAITSVNSSLPQDPTLRGVSIDAVMTGQQPVVDAEIPSFAPMASVGQQQQGFPAFGAQQQDHRSQQSQSALHGDESDLEDDFEEEFELDHSYTWLHYMILVAVAFVLGMIIWKVGLDSASSTPPEEPEEAAHSIAVDYPAFYA